MTRHQIKTICWKEFVWRRSFKLEQVHEMLAHLATVSSRGAVIWEIRARDMQLVSGIAKRAKMLTRVTATESVSENDKFTMRLFLVSLNFKGTEYAFARKFLIRNLTGNSGWRTEEAKARHDARKARTEIEAPEVTIGQSSEGGEADAGISE